MRIGELSYCEAITRLVISNRSRFYKIKTGKYGESLRKTKIVFEKTGSLALAERRGVLFVFAALFTFAIVRSATMKKFFPNP